VLMASTGFLTGNAVSTSSAPSVASPDFPRMLSAIL
jgi:hypothetical protein